MGIYSIIDSSSTPSSVPTHLVSCSSCSLVAGSWKVAMVAGVTHAVRPAVELRARVGRRRSGGCTGRWGSRGLGLVESSGQGSDFLSQRSEGRHGSGVVHGPSCSCSWKRVREGVDGSDEQVEGLERNC